MADEAQAYKGYVLPYKRHTPLREEIEHQLFKDIIDSGIGVITDWIPSESLKAPGTKPATLEEYGIGQSWKFANNNDETITARIKIPDYAFSNPTVSILFGWSSSVTDPGDDSKQARWQVEYLYNAVDSVMNAAAEGTAVDNLTVSTVAHGLVVSELSTPGLSVGDICMTIRLKRRADEAGDTLDSDDCWLHGLCLKIVTS